MQQTRFNSAAHRATVWTACGVAVASLAACGGSTAKTNGQPSSASTGTASASSTASASPSTDITASMLAAKMQAGAATLTSAHIALQVSTAGENVVGQGDEKLSGGKLTDLDLTERVGTITIGIRIIGKTVYAKLPTSGAPAGKPWVKASATSTNPVMRQLAASIASAQDSASLNSYRNFAEAATSVKTVGTTQIDGAPATQYDLVVDISKLPPTATSAQAMRQAGLTSLPVSLWLDDQGRPVQLVEKFSVQGKPVSTTVSIGKFNAPLTITPPPASQVSSL